MCPCRAAFFSMKYDLKARVQCNFFSQHYGCNLVCDSCMACKPAKSTEPLMNYRDFTLSAGHRLSRFSHRTYVAMTRPEELSPWICMPGWALETCTRDPMHVIYLGVCRDLLASLLADWMDANLLPAAPTQQERLRLLSLEMHAACKQAKQLVCSLICMLPCAAHAALRQGPCDLTLRTIRISFRRKFFTLANCNLGKAEFPELSTTWKAAEIKVVLWFLSVKAVELTAATEVSWPSPHVRI